MNYRSQYNAKKCSPAQAISLIQDKEIVYSIGKPVALLDAIYNEKKRFEELTLYSLDGGFGIQGEQNLSELKTRQGYITTMALKRTEEGKYFYVNTDKVPIHLSSVEDLIEQRCRPTLVIAHCSPMDREGYFYMDVSIGSIRNAINRGVKVLVEADENIPIINSDYYRIHINEVAAFCEVSSPAAFSSSSGREAEPAEEDKAIATFVAERIPDGATIQLDESIISDLIGYCLENHQDLGIHTECFTQPMIRLMKKGVVDNSKKTLLPGVSVAGLLGDHPAVREFVNKNDDILLKSLSWVCNPSVIRQNKDMISVNTCRFVDFRGQACSESIDLGVSARVGSQLDFARGSKRSIGGKSFLVMRSTFEDNSSGRVSAIMTSMPEGSVVSIPRCDVMYVVTEYGVADLQYRDIKERVKALISIAHPEFRDRLTFDAKKYGYV